jgi:hypothetical protein
MNLDNPAAVTFFFFKATLYYFIFWFFCYFFIYYLFLFLFCLCGAYWDVITSSLIHQWQYKIHVFTAIYFVFYYYCFIYLSPYIYILTLIYFYFLGFLTSRLSELYFSIVHAQCFSVVN